ncbi:MAG: hypothetical protein KIS96_11895 [Bauldia sp.]|nr:hypothetical protein [Bauldia sp.]
MAAPKILFILASRDDETLTALIAAAEAAERPFVIAAIDYNEYDRADFGGHPIIAPMSVLTPADVDAIYDAVHRWQRALTAHRLASGIPVAAAASPEGYAPAAAGWLLRFAPHIHLRIRLITYMTRLIERERPDIVCPVGYRSGAPWLETVLGGVMANRFPAIALLPPPALLGFPASWQAYQRTMQLIGEAHLAGINRQMERVSGFLHQQRKALRAVGEQIAAGGAGPAQGIPAVLLWHHLLQPDAVLALSNESSEAILMARELRELSRRAARLRRSRRGRRDRQKARPARP